MLSYISIAFLSVIVKMLNQDVSMATILFAEFSIPLLLLSPWFIQQRKHLAPQQHFFIQMSRAFFSVGALGCSFWALRYLPLAETVLLNNSVPLFLPLIAIVWFKEKISRMEWALIMCGFAGVLLVVHPGSEFFHVSALVALASAICGAMSLMCLKRLLFFKEKFVNLLYFFFFVGTTLIFPFFIHYYEPLTYTQLGMCVILGLLILSSQVFFITAYRFTSPVKLAPLNFMVVVFGVILGYSFFGTLPDQYSFTGALIILSTGVMTAITFSRRRLRERREAKKAPIPLPVEEQDS
ncbi:MAG: Pseudopaline exporter CntI [Chlamydiia bacterium]|nr:Pseudopaline exporter CntI [Chlamydiia bacterium]